MSISSNNQAPDIQDILAQMNAQTQHFGVDTGDALPGGVNPGSLSTWQDEAKFYLSKADSSRQFQTPFALSKGLSSFLPISRSALPPAVADLPADGDFGWHLDTLTGFYYWALNDAGAVVFPNFASISGTLNFTRLAGELTDSQHGDRGGGSLHAVATDSVDGFMAASEHEKLRDITATGSPANILNCTLLYIDGTATLSGRFNNTRGAITENSDASYTSNEQAMLTNIKLLLNEIRAGLLSIGIAF